MKKIAVVYWSGTGNTQMMAEAVAEGVREKGGDVSVFTATEFEESKMGSFDGIAFGCPSMGSEVLEESEFEPMFTSCLGKLNGKRIALFGSYGWGNGEWMKNWEAECDDAGAQRVSESVICNNAPTEDGLSDCKMLGGTLAD